MKSLSRETASSRTRAKLKHPVIDSDGHWVEFRPVYDEYLKQELGATGLARYWKAIREYAALGGNPDDDTETRRRAKLPGRGFWAVPTRELHDRAAVQIPKILYDRLGDFGLDFAVLYPTSPSLTTSGYLPDDELRVGGIRAFNRYTWDMFKDYADRMTPVSMISAHTPAEAIAELEAVKKLGFKAICMAGPVQRPMPGRPGQTYWDALAIDSDYDYDPVWAKCQDLGFAPTFHTLTSNYGYRTSRSNFVFNHVGHFAQGCEVMCKAMFLGGVPHRFPKLKIAFLEGGASWAVNLYNDMVRHWNVRNPKALENFNPDNLDRDGLRDLMLEYGPPVMKQVVRDAQLNRNEEVSSTAPDPKNLNDFARAGIEHAEQIRDAFENNFYYGCEGEDPLTSMAFNTKANAFGARLNVIMGSDIGHFDVLDMGEVLEEAYELVEHDVLSEAQFRDVVFANAARFWTSQNRDFFKGTVVEDAVNKELAAGESVRQKAA